MQIHDEQIRYWIQRFQKGDTVSAFHGLVEAGREIIPEIIGLYNGTPDRKLKTFLINVIRCYCDPSTVSFFRDALFDSNSDVWKEALDGLVSIASQPALDALLSAKNDVS